MRYLEVSYQNNAKDCTSTLITLIPDFNYSPSIDDEFALKKSHSEIRSAFEKNRGLKDSEQIKKSIELAEQVEEILRKEVMQARFVTDDKVRVNVRLDNVRDAKAKTFSFIDDD